jgi:hypothetical protein
MKNSLLLLFVILTFLSCQKDETPPPPKDYTAFLANTTPSFRGAIGGMGFNWQFGGLFQMAMGYENGSGLCIPDDPERMLSFGLTSNDGGKNWFKLYTPVYDAGSKTDLERIFTIGKHKLGNFRKDFYLTIQKDGLTYQTSGAGIEHGIEILKVTEIEHYLGPRLRVWFVINAPFNNCNCTQGNTKLSDGLMVAEFMWYAMEK